MKNIKLFENFSLLKIEDVLMPFIDDNQCFVHRDRSTILEIDFFEYDVLLKAIERLKSHKLTNWAVYDLIILSYSDAIQDEFNKIWSDLKYIECELCHETYLVYYNSDKKLAFFCDREREYIYLSTNNWFDAIKKHTTSDDFKGHLTFIKLIGSMINSKLGIDYLPKTMSTNTTAECEYVLQHKLNRN